MVDIRKSGQTDEEQELEISEEEGVIGYVYDKFEDAENGRFSDEQRWLDAYKTIVVQRMKNTDLLNVAKSL